VNVDEDVLTDDAPDGVCELDAGPRLAPEAVRRLGCDASTVLLFRKKDGTLLTATNKTQSIPRRVRRMLRARDQGCRFPGCGQRTFVDAHHIHHRAQGGSNELENLVELGWTLRFDAEGDVVVTNPAGNVIPSLRALRASAGGLELRNRTSGITVEPDSITPRWYGDPLDLGHITTTLWCVDQRDGPSRNGTSNWSTPPERVPERDDAPVHAAAMSFDLHVPESRSLKAKRAAIRPIVDGLRHRFRISVAEVAHHDQWQRAEIAVAIVAESDGRVQLLLDGVERFVAAAPAVELLGTETAWLET
jgi:uncharacterized protein YlxP (DUF503 family)